MVRSNINPLELEDMVTKEIRNLNEHYESQKEDRKQPRLRDTLRAFIIAFFATSCTSLSYCDCMINLKKDKSKQSDKRYNSDSSNKNYSP